MVSWTARAYFDVSVGKPLLLVPVGARLVGPDGVEGAYSVLLPLHTRRPEDFYFIDGLFCNSFGL